MKHETSEIHQTCTEMLSNRTCQLRDSESNLCIQASLSAAFRAWQMEQQKEVLRNRKYIGRLSEIMRFLMRLGLAVRGHRESPDSFHRGNFVEIINLLWNSDEFLDTEILSRRQCTLHVSRKSKSVDWCNRKRSTVDDRGRCTEKQISLQSLWMKRQTLLIWSRLPLWCVSVTTILTHLNAWYH